MNVGSVRSRIILGFSAVIALMIAVCVFAYTQLAGIERQARSLEQDSVPGIYIIGRVQAISISTHALVEQHILERDSAKMQQIESEIDQKTAEISEFLQQYEPTIVRADDRTLFNAIRTALPPYLAARTTVLQLSANPGAKAQAVALLQGQLQPAYRNLQDKIQAEVDDNKSNADGASQHILAGVERAKSGLLLSLLVGVALALAAGYLLVQAINRPLSRLVAAMEVMRNGDFSQEVKVVQRGEFGVLASGLNLVVNSLQEMIRRVQKSGLQVNTSATEIAATAQEQLSTATQVAATTSEIGATSKEISTTSKELARTIREIAAVAEQTAALAGNGQTGLNRMKTTMQQVMEASASINARLATLSEKAGNIGTVVTTITKVADQTNLLSLNAAIEAEKAGDYGRGFSVVAAEIRRLADQTAVSTGDIEQMVKEIQSAVAAGVMGMDKFSEEVHRGDEMVRQVSDELSQIIHHVQALTPNFESVSEGMQSQSQGAQQISDALSQLSEASKQTVESLRQSNSAIGQLNDAARGLQDGVARFRLQA
ncbi:MAG TPA: methyl-accepting chemotaxis protein [Bryobacteraceae bacterium]|jgi:methyl-accepting chemotaxis protein WspA